MRPKPNNIIVLVECSPTFPSENDDSNYISGLGQKLCAFEDSRRLN